MSDTYGAKHLLFLKTFSYIKFTRIFLISGCCHTAEDEQTPSEQNVSVEVPQRNTKKIDLSSQKVCPWDMGNLALEGDLCGPEVLRTNPGQTLLMG